MSDARRAFEESLELHQRLKDRPNFATTLEHGAGLLAAEGNIVDGFRVAAATAAFRRSFGMTRPAHDQRVLDAWLTPARDALGAEADRLWAEGEALSLEAAITLATSGLREGAGNEARA